MGCGLSHLTGLNPTGTGSPAKNKQSNEKGEMKNKRQQDVAQKYRVGAIWEKAADIPGWYNAVTPDGWLGTCHSVYATQHMLLGT